MFESEIVPVVNAKIPAPINTKPSKTLLVENLLYVGIFIELLFVVNWPNSTQ